jgi:hypothetical protein
MNKSTILDTLIIILIVTTLLSLVSVSASDNEEIMDFIDNLKQNPSNFTIVTSNSLSENETNIANELSNITNVRIMQDTEVSEIKNLILIGSQNKNIKVTELEDSSQNNLYIYENNLFISGNSQENIEDIEKILIYYTNNLPIQYNSQDSSQQSSQGSGFSETDEEDTIDPIQQNDREIIQGKDLTEYSAKRKWSVTATIALILALIVVGIITFLIISFIKKPKIGGT